MSATRAPDETASSALPTIRHATAADLDPLAALEAACFGDAAWSRRLIAEELEASTALVLVAESPAGSPAEPGGASPRDASHADREASTERILFAYAAFRRAAGEAELLRVAAAPGARRGGLAAALLAAGLDRLRAEGTSACFLEVDAGNTPAIALYRRFGFRPAGHRPRYYPSGTDALLMRLGLAPDLDAPADPATAS